MLQAQPRSVRLNGKEVSMTSITINYAERDSEPERLEKLAEEHGISVEMLVKRFVSEGLGGYGLSDIPDDEEFEDVEQMLVRSGALKPK